MPDRGQLEGALKKLDAGIAKLEAALAKVEAGLKQARSGLGKLESASAQTSDAKQTLTGVQKVARAALDGRDAAIALAEAQRDLAVLRAPADGVVVATVEAGEAVDGRCAGRRRAPGCPQRGRRVGDARDRCSG